MKLLLLGSNGYMGQKFMSYLQDDHTIETLSHEKVSVQNLPEPKGFLITASGGPGIAELTVCSNYFTISDGDAVEITC